MRRRRPRCRWKTSSPTSTFPKGGSDPSDGGFRPSPTSSWYAVKGPNGDLTWRVESPAYAVGAKVNYIPDGAGWKRIYYPNTGRDFPWSIHGVWEDGSRATVRTKNEWDRACQLRRKLADTSVRYPNQEGVSAVFTRPLAFLAMHMLAMRQQGLRVLAEVDDFYLAPSHFNVFTKKATRSLSWDDYSDDHARSLCSGDGIIFSTDHLRDQYHRALRDMFGKKDLPEFFVCRNHVDERFIPTDLVPPREDGKLRVGYMGSDSHYWDVELIYPALREAYENGHEIVFVGINPRYSMNRPSRYEERSRQHWWEIEFTHIPWSNTFRGVALPLDIGFAPLQINQSTLGKSDIKALEFGLSGAACVAQNCLVYNRTLSENECLFATSPAEFVLQMRRLIKDAELRRSLVAATNDYIRRERMLLDHKNEWAEAVYG